MAKSGFLTRLFSKRKPEPIQKLQPKPNNQNHAETPTTLPPQAILDTRNAILDTGDDKSLIPSLTDPDRITSFREQAPEPITQPIATDTTDATTNSHQWSLQEIPTLNDLRVNELLGSYTTPRNAPTELDPIYIPEPKQPQGVDLLRSTSPVMPAIMSGIQNEKEKQLIDMVKLLEEESCIFFKGLTPSALRQLVDKISGFEDGGIYTIHPNDWILVHPNHHIPKTPLKPAGLTILFEDGLFKSVLPPTQYGNRTYNNLGVKFAKKRGEAIGEASFAQFPPVTSVQYIGDKPIQCMYIPTDIFKHTHAEHGFPPDFAQIVRIVTLRNVLRSTIFLKNLNIENRHPDQIKLPPLMPFEKVKMWFKTRYVDNNEHQVIAKQTFTADQSVKTNLTIYEDGTEYVGMLITGSLNIYSDDSRKKFLSTLQVPGLLFGERAAILEDPTANIFAGKNGAVVQWLPLTQRVKDKRDAYEEDLRILIESIMEKIHRSALITALSKQQY